MNFIKASAGILLLLVLAIAGCRSSGSKLASDEVQTSNKTEPKAPRKIATEVLLDFL